MKSSRSTTAHTPHRVPSAGPDSAASLANPEGMFTTQEVATAIAVGKRTVESWIASGDLRVVRFSKRCVRVRRRDLDEFIRRHLSGGR